jgi:hypothetical protein
VPTGRLPQSVPDAVEALLAQYLREAEDALSLYLF